MEKLTGKGVAKKLNQHEQYLSLDFLHEKTITHNQKQTLSITPIVTEHIPNQHSPKGFYERQKITNNIPAGTLQTLRH